MNKNHKNWTLFFGIITASVIVLSQLFWFQAPTFSKKNAESKQKQDNAQQEEAHISLPSSSLPSGTSVEHAQQSSFIHEILFEQEKASELSTSLPTTISRLFQTLFRVIIAPNAP